MAAAASASTGRPRATRIDDFTMNGELGKGQFGTVYRATHTASGKQFALKGITSTKAKEQEDAVREGRLVKELKHVNICGVLDVFWEAPSTVWILMEFCAKGVISDKLKTASKQQRYMWAAQLLDALVFVHARGMIHRDIKSDNILLSELFILKLGDFGLSRIMPRAESGVRMTIAGTPLYLAPELLTGSYDNKVDVFSVGVVLYELFNQGDLLFAPGQKCFGLHLIGAPTFDIYNYLTRVAKPSDTMVAECRLLTQMLQPNPVNRLTITQAQENFRPLLDAVCPGYTAPVEPGPQWYEGKEGKAWAGLLFERVGLGFPRAPAAAVPSMQRVVVNKNLQLHMPVLSNNMAVHPSRPEHKWMATLVLEFPSNFPRAQATLAIKGEAAVAYKVDKAYTSLAEEVMPLQAYVNTLLQLASDGHACALLLSMGAWTGPSSEAAAWPLTPTGREFVSPLIAALNRQYSTCTLQPNIFNTQVHQYVLPLPRPAGEAKGVCRARLIFPAGFPVAGGVAAATLVLTNYNGVSAHQLVNVNATSVHHLSSAVATDYHRRLTDALAAVHGPLSAPAPIAPTTPTAAAPSTPAPTARTATAAPGAGFPSPPPSTPAHPPTHGPQWYTTPEGKRMLGETLKQMKANFGDCVIERAISTADLTLKVPGPVREHPALVAVDFSWSFPTTPARCSIGTHLPVNCRTQTMNPEALVNELLLIYSELSAVPSTPMHGTPTPTPTPAPTPAPAPSSNYPAPAPTATPTGPGGFTPIYPAGYPMSPHAPSPYAAAPTPAPTPISPHHVPTPSSAYAAPVPEPTAPLASFATPPAGPPQWYLNEGKTLFQALLAFCNTEIGPSRIVKSAASGNVELHFSNGMVIFPSNFPLSPALVLAPPTPTTVPAPIAMPSGITPVHAQCAFVLDIKAALARGSAASDFPPPPAFDDAAPAFDRAPSAPPAEEHHYPFPVPTSAGAGAGAGLPGPTSASAAAAHPTAPSYLGESYAMPAAEPISLPQVELVMGEADIQDKYF